MRLRCFIFACTLLALFLFTTSASAGCWTCSTTSGCCGEQAQGKYGSTICSAIQTCIGTCVCTSCDTMGSLCEGTAAPECEKPLGTCKENQTSQEAPQVVPNGESIDLHWLISPPVSPAAGANTRVGIAGCATVV